MKDSLFIQSDIREAKTLHTDFYTQNRYFEASKETIFAPSWQYIGHTDIVEEIGSQYPFLLLENFIDEPLLLTKSKENKIHCLSNVCTHRGNLLTNSPCKSSQLRCKYHGRVFDLEGKFIYMPEFQEVKYFPCENDNLKALPIFQIGKLLFTSLTPTLSTDLFFAEMLTRIGWLPLEKLEFREELSSTYHVKANWALYCENYLEGFHIPFVHAGLNQVIDYGDYTTEIYKYSNLQLGIGKKGENCFDLPNNSPDFGKNVAAYYFWVFPNMMFNFYPWGLSFNLVEPISISETKVSFKVFVFDESKLEKGAGAGLNQVELEDEEIVENVQRGVRSRFYTQGRYSARMEQGPHHFHSLICEFLNQ